MIDYGQSVAGMDYIDGLNADYKWENVLPSASSKSLRQRILPDYSKRNAAITRTSRRIK